MGALAPDYRPSGYRDLFGAIIVPFNSAEPASADRSKSRNGARPPVGKRDLHPSQHHDNASGRPNRFHGDMPIILAPMGELGGGFVFAPAVRMASCGNSAINRATSPPLAARAISAALK